MMDDIIIGKELPYLYSSIALIRFFFLSLFYMSSLISSCSDEEISALYVDSDLIGSLLIIMHMGFFIVDLVGDILTTVRVGLVNATSPESLPCSSCHLVTVFFFLSTMSSKLSY